jgi:hypothetical protein
MRVQAATTPPAHAVLRATFCLPLHVLEVSATADAAFYNHGARHPRVLPCIGFGLPMAAVVPTPPTIFVLSGDRVEGQCATSLLANCSRQGGSYRCN